MERGTFKLDAKSLKILSTVKPDLVKVILRAAEMTTVPFAVVSGNRTQAEQDRLYAQGRTRPGLVVTWTRKSNHIGGGAIDFSAVDANGKPNNHRKETWNAAHYKPIADVILAAGRELGIPVEWPLWRKGDWGHVQLGRPMAAQLRPVQPDKNKMATKDTLKDPKAALAFLMGLGWEKHQAAAIVGQGIWESGGKDHLATTALGDFKTAHGAFQWRKERYAGPQGLLSFTLLNHPGRSSSEAEVQLRFCHWELTAGPEKRAGNALKAATNVEEASKAFVGYLRPVHWTLESPEKAHGFEKRLKLAQSLM